MEQFHCCLGWSVADGTCWPGAKMGLWPIVEKNCCTGGCCATCTGYATDCVCCCVAAEWHGGVPWIDVDGEKYAPAAEGCDELNDELCEWLNEDGRGCRCLSSRSIRAVCSCSWRYSCWLVACCSWLCCCKSATWAAWPSSWVRRLWLVSPCAWSCCRKWVTSALCSWSCCRSWLMVVSFSAIVDRLICSLWATPRLTIRTKSSL